MPGALNWLICPNSGYMSYTDASAAQNVPVEILMSESQRDIIVIARSDRYIDVERQGPLQRIQPPQAQLEVRYEHDRLEVHAVGVTAAHLLNEIGRRTGIRISLTEPSPAVASLHLQDMTLTQVLDSVARAYGLVLGRIDGAYALAPGWPTGEAAYHFATQRTFQIQYLRAERAANLLPNALDRHIQVDRDHNALVATGAPALLDKIGADLALIDQPAPLIEIEAIVVDMAREYDLIQELNVQFADGTTSLAWATGSGDISFRIVRDPLPRVRAALSALEQRGTVRTNVQARVTAFNGQYALLFGGALQYFPSKTSRARRQEITLQRADVGVRLSGWFYTGGEDVILSQLYLRADNIVNVDPQGLPRVARRYARSFLRLSDGDTVYIGGLTVKEKTTRDRRVPVLGDLPWVGALFRSRVETGTERTLAVFLTVRLTDKDADVLRRPPPETSLVLATPGLDPDTHHTYRRSIRVHE